MGSERRRWPPASGLDAWIQAKHLLLAGGMILGLLVWLLVQVLR
jgi:hypothetical protein